MDIDGFIDRILSSPSEGVFIAATAGTLAALVYWMKRFDDAKPVKWPMRAATLALAMLAATSLGWIFGRAPVTSVSDHQPASQPSDISPSSESLIAESGQPATVPAPRDKIPVESVAPPAATGLSYDLIGTWDADKEDGFWLLSDGRAYTNLKGIRDGGATWKQRGSEVTLLDQDGSVFFRGTMQGKDAIVGQYTFPGAKPLRYERIECSREEPQDNWVCHADTRAEGIWGGGIFFDILLEPSGGAYFTNKEGNFLDTAVTWQQISQNVEFMQAGKVVGRATIYENAYETLMLGRFDAYPRRDIRFQRVHCPSEPNEHTCGQITEQKLLRQ
jgi:hypothetical protein